MPNQKIYNRGYRIRKAYWTAFRVMLSYGFLYLKSKIFGSKYYQRKIKLLHVKNAHKVKDAILSLQGLFIKVGQLLSILTNFLPEAFHEPLEALQDHIPSRPYEEIVTTVKAELGAAPDELYGKFSEVPIAAASIGQVHAATLKDGTKVAVKVQHQNIAKVAKVDLDIMQRLTKLTAWFFDINGLEYAYTQVRDMIEEELDFKQEAASMTTISENLQAEEGIKIPQVFSALSTSRVLTSSFCEGVKLSNTNQIKEWGLSSSELATKLIKAYCKMVFEDGFYHADPHPGNLLIDDKGTITFLDFGAVATLQPNTRDGLLQLIEGATKNDSKAIVSALRKMGFIAHDREAEKIALKVIAAFRNFIQNEVQLEGLNFKELKVNPFQTSLFSLITDIGLKELTGTVQVPKDYVLLNRMLTLLMGITNTLDSNINPMQIMQPYIQKYVLGEQGDMVQYITKLAQQGLTSMLTLPGDIKRVIETIESGEVEISSADGKYRNMLFYYLGQQFMWLICTLGLIVYMHSQHIDANLYFWLKIIAFGMGFLFLRAMYKSRNIKKKMLS